MTGSDPARATSEALLQRLSATWIVVEREAELRELTMWVGIGRYPDALPEPPEGAAERTVDLAEATVAAVIADLRAAGHDV